MGVEREAFRFLLLLLILLSSHEGTIMKAVEGRICESKSHGFKGPCMTDHNCALVCRNEGFSGGKCRGVRHRCFCTKLC
ncbi:Defensin-like protein 1 [Camellia lanceoleosa]|uniref:Defensin-like protein 1 n=1 Tax=Camellia lanceoleosa TaxID=1840588 RepID=A0ACC0G8G5_9ERIC|nr:Defensin-like protein 1 [Camellia lanceoleosa]